MVFSIGLLIRKIRYRKRDGRPTQYLLAFYRLNSTMKGEWADLIREPGKGFGPNVRIMRVESSFCRFLRATYGVGDYSILQCVGGYKGFKLFGRYLIEKDRFVRSAGSISPYLMTISPMKAWHDLPPEKEKN